MLRLPKKIEYAILAMQYIASHSDKIVSAKELSEELNLAYEFLSKTLQSMIKSGLVMSQQGVRGGYSLTKSPEETSLSDVITALSERTSIVSCFSLEEESSCKRSTNCALQFPMKQIQSDIDTIFSNTTIADLNQRRILIT